MPANTLTKLKGIIIFEGEAPMRAAMALMTGKNMITIGVLLMNALVMKTAKKALTNVTNGRLS